jgi:hypothetical protein
MNEQTTPINWRELIVTDTEAFVVGTLGEVVDLMPANLDNIVIENGRISEWQDYFISAPGEDCDHDTPAGPVDWTGFEHALAIARGQSNA